MPRNPNERTSADGLTTTRDIAWWDENDPQRPGYKGPRNPQEVAGDAPFDPVNGASAEARRWLDQPKTQPWETGQVASPEEFETLMQPPAPSRQGSLRGLTEAFAKPAPYLGAAALGTAVTGVGASASPFLGAAAGISAGPDIARRFLMPEEDESRVGAGVEAALYGLPAAIRSGAGRAVSGAVGRGAKSLQGLFRSADKGKPAGWVSKASNVSEGGVGANVSNFASKPKPSAATAPERFGKADWDEHLSAIEKRKGASTPDAPSGGGHHRGQPRELDPNRFKGQSANMWDEAPPGRLSPKLTDKLRQSGSGLDDASFAGERNVNTSDNSLLDALPDGSEMSQAEYGPNLMDYLKRQTIPGRSRAFRDNVPFVE